MNDTIKLEIPEKEATRDPNKTYYKVIEHKNSNRRRHERNFKNPTTISYQSIRDGPRPVDVKRLARAKNRALRQAVTE